jgi:hypothetical protein
VQLFQTVVTHQVTPTSLTKPPVAVVDVQSQRRRSLRTRTGIGLGAGWLPRPEPRVRRHRRPPRQPEPRGSKNSYPDLSPSRTLWLAGSPLSSDSVCATATGAATAASLGSRSRRIARRAHRREDRQQPHRTRVTSRTLCWLTRLRHRTTNLEIGITCSATEFVERHRRQCRHLVD